MAVSNGKPVPSGMTDESGRPTTCSMTMNGSEPTRPTPWTLQTDEAVFLGFTKLAERPKGMASNRSILLGESQRGIAPPIIGWYPTGDVMGHEFVYGEKARRAALRWTC
jgi:hypothetical protein